MFRGRPISKEQAYRKREDYYSKLSKKVEALKALVVEAIQKLGQACVNSNLENILRFVVTKSKGDDTFKDISVGVSVDRQDFKVDVTSLLVTINELVRASALMISARDTNNGPEFVFVEYPTTTKQ